MGVMMYGAAPMVPWSPGEFDDPGTDPMVPYISPIVPVDPSATQRALDLLKARPPLTSDGVEAVKQAKEKLVSLRLSKKTMGKATRAAIDEIIGLLTVALASSE